MYNSYNNYILVRIPRKRRSFPLLNKIRGSDVGEVGMYEYIILIQSLKNMYIHIYNIWRIKKEEEDIYI